MAKPSLHRLRKEYRNITREPPPHITAKPLSSNILKWYFILEGPSGSPYEGGVYMGKLHFPEQYPYKPPAVYMCTPQGRFKCNQKLCLSMSDFHPETWNPLWSVSAVLTGLLSFMLASEDTVGSIQTSVSHKCRLARLSHQFNRSDKIFQELFPEYIHHAPPPNTHALINNPLNEQQLQNTSTNRHQRRQRHVAGTGTGNPENESESLFSLIMWLFVFVAFIFAIVRLISGSSSS